jgi:hypothetical protein
VIDTSKFEKTSAPGPTRRRTARSLSGGAGQDSLSRKLERDPRARVRVRNHRRIAGSRVRGQIVDGPHPAGTALG